MGELYYGARKSVHSKANLERLDSFIFQGEVLNCDIETAQYYGLIKSRLRRKGRPIPENDIWIAATVQQYELTLVTRDIHFQDVEGLPLEQW